MTEQIWAPWRMDYILGQRDAACIFCDFAAAPTEEHRKKLVLHVAPHVVIALNRYPFTTSHLLVAPRRHVSDLSELSGDEYHALVDLLREAAARVRKATNAEAMNIGFNLGKAAGAGIADHLHGHIVPRWTGDTNFMPVLADVRVMPEYLDDAYARLLPHFADLNAAKVSAAGDMKK